MNDATPDTDANNDVEQTEESATAPEVKAPESPKPKEQDVKNLVSQRDANFEKARSLEERLDQIEAEKARDTYISDFLKENTDYTYVESDDLKEGTSPEEIKAIADRVQTKAEKLKAQIQEEFNKVPEPIKLTGKDKATRLDELKESASKGDKDAFGKMLEVEGIL